MEQPLNGDELFLLRWLSEADTSALGECKGASLDTLLARGFAVIIAHRVPADYSRVALTEPGLSFLRAFEEGGPADADTPRE